MIGRVKGCQLSKNKNNNNNSDNNSIFPPPSPPSPPPGRRRFMQPPPPPPFQPESSIFDSSFQSPRPRSDISFGDFHIPAQLSSANFNKRDRGLFVKVIAS